MHPSDFAQETPRLLPEEFFLGHTEGSGVFFDRFGKIQKRFIIDLHGKQQEDGFFLNELLRYSDGETVTREYRFTKINENLYEATADGVVGKATIEAYGNTLRWSYRLKQMINGSEWTLTFDDWMFLQESGVLLNRAKAYKFGIFVGEVFMSVRKLP
jgi:hypothetical protein